jgi:hypothetical protein
MVIDVDVIGDVSRDVGVDDVIEATSDSLETTGTLE